MSFTASNDDAASSALYSFSSFLTSLLPSARADEAAPAPSDDSEEDKSADSSSKEDKEDSDDKATEAGDNAEEGEGAGEEAEEEEEEEEEEPEDVRTADTQRRGWSRCEHLADCLPYFPSARHAIFAVVPNRRSTLPSESSAPSPRSASTSSTTLSTARKRSTPARATRERTALRSFVSVLSGRPQSGRPM